MLWAHSADSKARFVLALIYMGFRIDEIAELVPADVHLDEGYCVSFGFYPRLAELGMIAPPIYNAKKQKV